jgi:hypothetical protein
MAELAESFLMSRAVALTGIALCSLYAISGADCSFIMENGHDEYKRQVTAPNTQILE